MPRQSAANVENNFSGGLKTDFSGLNFPENSCTETFNCIFNKTGLVTRRYGIDLERAFTTFTVNRTASAISTYVWKNVAGDGNTTLLVVQVGATLYFYNASASNAANPLSSQKLAGTITLSTYAASGGVAIATNECQYADGNGYLYVTHPGMEPIYIDYNAGTPAATAITIQIRDFKGISGDSADTARPTSITDTHRYNLGNQGWQSRYLGTSSTSITIGTGSKTFTTQSTLNITAGDRVRVYSAATPGSLGSSTNTGNIMIGTVTSYTTTSLVVNVTATNGAGTLTDWRIVEEPDNLEAWNVVLSNYPSNCDVWWLYKNSSDVFAPTTKALDTYPGNTPAPKGHFILSAFSQDRATASGITGLTTTSTSGARPTTCAFFQGRVFYAGVQAQGYNSNLYFTQIIEQNRTDQFGRCYQSADPTSEDVFDLLSSDGGVIQIQGAGTIIKLFPVQGSLVVFCSNGIWVISGNQGVGFTATDYTISRLAEIEILSASSFVNVLGYPVFWTAESIYTVTPSQNGGGLEVQSMTIGVISEFYNSIPLSSKRFVRGYYNPIEYVIQWVYKSTEAVDLTDTYEFDSILNYNTYLKAFYPWTVGDGNPDINGIFVVSGVGGIVTDNQVTSNSGVDTVQDGSGNNVTTSSITGQTVTEPTFKYLCSYADSGSYKLTIAEHYDLTLLDWDGNATGIDYDSYFITGYKVHGDAQRKVQPNYVYVFSLNDEPTTYTIQGIWSFANSGASGQFSVQQRVTTPETRDLDGINYDVVYRRHKIRGDGLAYQLKIASVTGEPFKIVGWSTWETANAHV